MTSCYRLKTLGHWVQGSVPKRHRQITTVMVRETPTTMMGSWSQRICHSGIYGNEQADQLAKAASFKSYVGPEPVLPVPTSVVQSQLHACTLRETQTRWQDLISCRQAKKTIDGLNHQQTKEMLCLSRKMLRLIVSVYTKHNCLNRHLSVLWLTNSPKCGNCNEADETALHYLCYCIQYGAVRTRIWGKPFLHPSEVPHTTVKDLLRFLTSSWRFS